MSASSVTGADGTTGAFLTFQRMRPELGLRFGERNHLGTARLEDMAAAHRALVLLGRARLRIADMRRRMLLSDERGFDPIDIEGTAETIHFEVIAIATGTTSTRNAVAAFDEVQL